ncbi:MAG: hypothetical protein CSA58_02885 [Micrococcales bacterium]|nr:MAG: hypothetical protein CSA58_02885 [Micrococcales bacterium]
MESTENSAFDLIQAQTLQAIRTLREATLNTLQAAGQMSIPKAQAKAWEDAFGDPRQLVDSTYEFAAQLLELNRQFAQQLLDMSRDDDHE